MGSSPTRKWLFRQSALLRTPVFWFRFRLSMVIAAQYWVAVHPFPVNCSA